MKKSTQTLLAIGGFALAIALCTVGYQALSKGNMPQNSLGIVATPAPSASQTPETKKNQAPDFTVYDQAGEAHLLSDYFGKPIVLNFWASWCGPCQSEMPAFEAVYQARGEDIQFLMVNMTDGMRETQAKAEAFVEKGLYTFPVLFDTKYSAASTYGVNTLPRSYFLDAEGNLIATANSAIDQETLEYAVSLIEQTQ